MWVPLVENRELNNSGTEFFVKKNIDNLLYKDPHIDSVILGCTHYPLLLDKIRKFMPDNVEIISQGEIVAQSLKDYLKRHPEMDAKISKNGTTQFYTTESESKFEEFASLFLNKPVKVKRISID